MPEESTGLDATLRGLRPSAVVFDRYELLRVLGRGGMGVVWQARDHRLELDVALKFLPEGIVDDAQALDDLKRETRRCRELAHEHIVRVHDLEHSAASALAAISMECVVGQTLKAIKDAAPDRCLDPEAILPWVRQLADALTYAHERRKIVHRDLKPANLMLGVDGALKVMDFGIARSIAETTGRTLGVSGSSGTPAYMSPQQIRGNDKPTASDDIYAFGATLYELLTSRPPFFRGDVNSIIYQAMQERPAGLNARREELGIQGRPPIPPEWEDTILACLAKEPADRPATIAEALARLSTPVEPAPEPPEPDITQTAPAPLPPAPRRSSSGRWIAAGAGALILAAMAWHFAGKTTPAPAPAPQPAATVAQQIPATSTAPTPTPATPPPAPAAPAGPATSETSVTLLAQAEQERDDLRFSAALATARKAAEVPGLDQTPVAWERAQALLADLQHENGDYPAADATWRELIAAQTKRLGRDHADTLASRYERVDVLLSRSDYPAAVAEAEAIRQARHRLLGDTHPLTLRSRTQLAAAQVSADAFAQVIPELKAVLDLQKQQEPADGAALAETLLALAGAYYRASDFSAAQTAGKDALSLRQHLYGADHPKTLRVRRVNATITGTQGQAATALTDFRALIPIYERYFSPEHPAILATRQGIAWALRLQGLDDEALAEARALLPVCQRVFGPDGNTTLGVRDVIFALLVKKGQTDEALAEIRAMHDLAAKRYGPESSPALAYQNRIAAYLHQIGQSSEAISLFEKTLATAERTLPDPHALTGEIAYGLGATLNVLKRYAEAEPHLNRACEIRSLLFGPSALSSLSAQMQLGLSLSEQGKHALAATLLRPSFERSEQALGFSHTVTLHIANNLGFALSKIGKADEARSYCERVVKIARETLPADDPSRKIWEANLHNLTAPAPSKKKAK